MKYMIHRVQSSDECQYGRESRRLTSGGSRGSSGLSGNGTRAVRRLDEGPSCETKNSNSAGDRRRMRCSSNTVRSRSTVSVQQRKVSGI